MADLDTIRLRRVRHPVALAVVAVLLGVAIVGSFFLGRVIQAPTSDAIRLAQKPIRVWASVETRSVDSRTSFAGKAHVGNSSALTPTPLPDTPVVVRQTVQPGQPLHPADLIGIVSGVPYFILPGPLPLYRDLNVGDKGDDVTGLQNSLAAAGLKARVTGVVDASTIAAVSTLYTRNKLVVPTAPVVVSAQFLTAPADGAVVITVAPIGTHLDDKTALVTVRNAGDYVSFRADTITAKSLSPGLPMSVRIGREILDGTVQSIGEFDAGAGKQVAGRDVVVTSTDPRLATLDDGADVTVLGRGSAEKSLAVPVTALRQTATGGDYVLRRRSSGAPVKVGLTVIRTGGGWAAIGGTDLVPGDRVAVS